MEVTRSLANAKVSVCNGNKYNLFKMSTLNKQLILGAKKISCLACLLTS